jgi:NAD-dependent SIR2 family protein deacetylase
MAWLTCPKGCNAGREYDGERVAKCPRCKEVLRDKWAIYEENRKVIEDERKTLSDALRRSRK